MEDHFPQHEATPGHEPIETNVRAVWFTGIVLAGVVAVAFLIVLALMNWLGARRISQPTSPTADANTDSAAATLLQILRRRERDVLNAYRWIDPSHGVARIPLERALQIVAENGLPASLQTPANATLSPMEPAAGPSADSRSDERSNEQ